MVRIDASWESERRGHTHACDCAAMEDIETVLGMVNIEI